MELWNHSTYLWTVFVVKYEIYYCSVAYYQTQFGINICLVTSIWTCLACSSVTPEQFIHRNIGRYMYAYSITFKICQAPHTLRNIPFRKQHLLYGENCKTLKWNIQGYYGPNRVALANVVLQLGSFFTPFCSVNFYPCT